MNLSSIKKTAGAVALSLTILSSSIVVATPSTYAAPVVVAGSQGVVTNTDGDPIRVRLGAGTEYDQIGAVYEGQSVLVITGLVHDLSGRGWYMVQTESVTGWMMAEYLTGKEAAAAHPEAPAAPVAAPAPEAPVAAPAPVAAAPVAAAPVAPAAPVAGITGYARVAHTNGDRLRVRNAAGPTAGVIEMLEPDTLVKVNQGPVASEANITWYNITVDGTTGWVMGAFLKQADAPSQAAPAPAAAEPAAPAPAAEEAAEARTGTARGAEASANVQTSTRGDLIASIAMKFNGYRYRFGGASPSGFDCSGFVYYVTSQAGFNVGRTIPSQINSGPRIATKDLRPGDLLFWSNTYKRGLSHAGIYIGNGKFIHAENESTGVRITSMYTSYWASRYTGAVRPTR